MFRLSSINARSLSWGDKSKLKILGEKMGYTTNFIGQFDLDKQLSLDDYNILKHMGEDYEDSKPGQPDSYCQWVPTEDGRGIKWNEGEKFYKYEEWLQWIIDHVLSPRGYILTGSVAYQGEEVGDSGMLVITDGKVSCDKYDPSTASVKELVKKGLESDEDAAYSYLELIAEKLKIN